MSNSEQYWSEYYDEKCDHYGEGHQALGWRSRETQRLRYQQIHSLIANHTVSILDVGCGQGDLLTFLKENGWRGTYKGIDLSKKMIQLAKQRFSNTPFEVSSLANIGISHQSDIVVAFGTFSLRDVEGRSPKLGTQMKKMFQLAKKTVVINTLSTFAPEAKTENSRFAYYDPMQVLSLALSITSKVSIKHGTLPNDLTVFLHR